MKKNTPLTTLIPYFSLIGAVISIVGAFISLGITENKVSFLIYAVIASAIAALAYIQLLKSKRRLINGLDSIHQISQDFREASYKAYQNSDEAEVLQIELQAVESFCNKLKVHYEGLVGMECNVTIKLATYNEGDLSVSPYYTTDRKRRIFGYATPTSDSGIAKVLDTHSYFLSNDLHAEKNYYNSDSNWPKRYKSCIVVPIKRSNANGEFFELMGFLTIDSPETDAFQDTEQIRFIEYFSDQLYFFLSTIRGNLDAENELAVKRPNRVARGL